MGSSHTKQPGSIYWLMALQIFTQQQTAHTVPGKVKSFVAFRFSSSDALFQLFYAALKAAVPGGQIHGQNIGESFQQAIPPIFQIFLATAKTVYQHHQSFVVHSANRYILRLNSAATSRIISSRLCSGCQFIKERIDSVSGLRCIISSKPCS